MEIDGKSGMRHTRVSSSPGLSGRSNFPLKRKLDHPHARVMTSSGADAPSVIALARSWIGTPYVHQASVKGVGCDCLGLLRGVWREMGRDEPEEVPNYSPDWAEAGGKETLYTALARHFSEIVRARVAPGDIVLFRMVPRGPAKHCGIVAEKDGAPTLIHARQNKRVSEEAFSPFWKKKLAVAFRI
jgi:NlpC/P60 family putative phage cell wall peptidase